MVAEEGGLADRQAAQATAQEARLGGETSGLLAVGRNKDEVAWKTYLNNKKELQF